MGDTKRPFVVQKPEDDVATALTDLKQGTQLVDSEGHFDVELKQDIPFGHKFALRNLESGALVHKYGQVIGVATQSITAGEHVHVHNVDSRRGRGDLAKERSS